MRAARLLQILLILQNRGKQSCEALAQTLEVSRRTILRDVDALTEAGLPIIVHRGNQGGVELGFGYRSRLTGLDPEEAEAMGLLLAQMPTGLVDLGLAEAARRAQAKLREAFPDQTRAHMKRAQALFVTTPSPPAPPDPRRAAMALAVRENRIARLQAQSSVPVTIHPTALNITAAHWSVEDGLTRTLWPEDRWGVVNISARCFTTPCPGHDLRCAKRSAKTV